MASQGKGGWRVNRLAMGVVVFGVIVLAAGLFWAYQFVGPPPPRQIVLATGADGGAYQAYGERVAAYLRAQGISVELQGSAGAVENLDLPQSDSGVDADSHKAVCRTMLRMIRSRYWVPNTGNPVP